MGTNGKLGAKDYKTDQEVRWCPGCGDYAILAALQSFMPELDVPKENIVGKTFVTYWEAGSPNIGLAPNHSVSLAEGNGSSASPSPTPTPTPAPTPTPTAVRGR